MGNILDFLRKDTVKIVGGFLLFGSGLLLEWLVAPTAALIVFIAAVLFSGIEVFYEALLGILRRDVFDEKFLMSIGAVGALIIGKGSEACAVMLFFILGEYFEHLAVKRSRASIRSLMDICPDEASVIRNGVEQTVDAGEVEVGELIVIRSGERIPLDCEVTLGEADVDTAHLTGESLPRSVGVGSVAESGSVVLNGMLKARALRVASESSASRILALVETASENKAKEEYFITKFSRYYTPTVVLLAALIGTVPPIFGWLSLTEAVYRALVFLVFSCPCALVISVPMAFFGGIGCAASRGILYKGGNVMSSLYRAKIFAFDKTGTLTTGKLEISDIKAFGVEKDELLRLAASVEYGSRHPIADCIKSAADKYEVPTDVHELSGKGIEAVVSGEKLFVGNARLVTERGIKAIPEPGGKTHVYVGSGERLYGVISFSDGVREEAAAAVTALKELGVKKMVMLTGDVAEAAVSVADSVGIARGFRGGNRLPPFFSFAWFPLSMASQQQVALSAAP